MHDLDKTLSSFQSISLEEMDNVKLMNRTDTKFVFSSSFLIEILNGLSDRYRILEIEGKKKSLYNTVYFDTEQLKFYTQHHNGKLNRHKVRMRKYVNSDICFLEIKFKNSKGRTIKNRIKKNKISDKFSKESTDFIQKYANVNSSELSPKLWNRFNRITLVQKKAKERITLDLNLEFSNDNGKADVPELIIAEVKQEKYNVRSDFIQIMRKWHIKPMRMSKYCVGSVLLNGDLKSNLFHESFKYNRFKEKVLTINKLNYGIRA